MIKKLGYYLFAFFFTIFRLAKLNRNKVFFVATHDDSDDGNIGIVLTQIRRQMPEKKCILLTKKDGISHPFSFFVVKAYHIATAGTIFMDNEFMPMAYTPISKRTKVVQLWHGTGTIKKFGQDTDTKEVAYLAAKANKRITHLIVNSERTRRQYASAFGVPDDRIYTLGLPRTDKVLDSQAMGIGRDRFYTQYPELQGKYITLYAPTFRDAEVDKPSLAIDPASIVKAMGDDEVLLVRLHPHVAARCDESVWRGYEDRIINVSRYEGVASLLSVADRLITDYSSIVFEYCLLDRVMIFYPYDYDDFVKQGRSFYEDYASFVPGPIAYTEDELIDMWSYREPDIERLENFKKENFTYLDQNATKRLLELIFDTK